MITTSTILSLLSLLVLFYLSTLSLLGLLRLLSPCTLLPWILWFGTEEDQNRLSHIINEELLETVKQGDNFCLIEVSVNDFRVDEELDYDAVSDLMHN